MVYPKVKKTVQRRQYFYSFENVEEWNDKIRPTINANILKFTVKYFQQNESFFPLKFF